MKKLKLSKRTKNMGIATALCAGATVITLVKDQVNEISMLNNKVQDMFDKAFDSLNYELELESFIATKCGEGVLQILNS